MGNLLLLLPLGLLGPIAFPALNGWIRVFVVALAFSVAIEVAQLWIPNRMADVDDVLLNVAGAMLGYAVLSVARLASGPHAPFRRPTDLKVMRADLGRVPVGGVSSRVPK